jgi:phosphoribosylformylglycinamidine cyclo-ligase
VQGKNLRSGDAIVLIESSGVHANGISLIRELAEQLDAGYQTLMDDGSTLGEAALTPTHLYAKLVLALQAAGLDIHYLSNITGHGWRKIMRATEDFSYVMKEVPPVPEIFRFIGEHAENDSEEMYGTYNMGAGYAVYVPQSQAGAAQKIAKDCGFQSWNAGEVQAGPKQVIIEPLNITFASESLGVR